MYFRSSQCCGAIPCSLPGQAQAQAQPSPLPRLKGPINARRSRSHNLHRFVIIRGFDLHDRFTARPSRCGSAGCSCAASDILEIAGDNCGSGARGLGLKEAQPIKIRQRPGRPYGGARLASRQGGSSSRFMLARGASARRTAAPCRKWSKGSEGNICWTAITRSMIFVVASPPN